MSVTLEFHLRPTDPAVSLGDHLFRICRRFCEFFFDDAAYPCLVNVMALGHGFMWTKDIPVRDAADAFGRLGGNSARTTSSLLAFCYHKDAWTRMSNVIKVLVFCRAGPEIPLQTCFPRAIFAWGERAPGGLFGTVPPC